MLGWRNSKAMNEADFEATRQPSQDQRRLPVRGPDADRGTDRPTDQHVALPVTAGFDPRDGVIERQNFECINSRMVVTVRNHERGRRAGDRGDLATGNTLVANAMEKQVRVAGLRATFTLEHPLGALRDGGGDRRGIQ